MPDTHTGSLLHPEKDLGGSAQHSLGWAIPLASSSKNLKIWEAPSLWRGESSSTKHLSSVEQQQFSKFQVAGSRIVDAHCSSDTPTRGRDDSCAVERVYRTFQPILRHECSARLLQPLPLTHQNLRGGICAPSPQKSQYFNFILYLRNGNRSITFII